MQCWPFEPDMTREIVSEAVTATSTEGTDSLSPSRAGGWTSILAIALAPVFAIALIVTAYDTRRPGDLGAALFAAAVVTTAIPVYQRIRRHRARRVTWILLLAAELLTAAAGARYGALPGGTNPFSPPVANLALSALISLAAVVFVSMLTYASLRVLDTNLMIDALAGGLSISSALAWLYVRRAVAPLSVVVNGLSQHQHVAIGAGLVVIIVITSTAAIMVDVTGDWLMLPVLGAAVVISVGEVLAHDDASVHSTRWGLLIDLCWIGAYLLLGRAADQDDGTISEPGSHHERTFAHHQSRKVAIFGVVAIAVIALAESFGDPPVVAGLALAALTALLLRLLVSLRMERTHSLRFEELSVTDPLTGLANRRGLALAGSSPAGPDDAGLGGVVIIDLDNFKEINDSLGHRAGDLALTAMAQRLRSSLESGLVLARLGGDEFAISSSRGRAEHLQDLALQMEALVRDPLTIEDLSLHLSASIGVAARSDPRESQEELLRRADVAMYRAKENHSGVRVYDYDHDRNDPSRLVLYGLVSDAVRDETIDVHLQPLVEVASSRVVGFEALARWSPEGYGPIPPDRFVPMIELQGLIVPFTAHVLRQALAGVTSLVPAGPAYRVSVNVSERDFINADFPAVVASALSATDFPPELLTIEIVEGVLANDDARIDQCIGSLRSTGVRVSIDDFGTGYSTLSKLVDFTVDEIKIDRSFVARVLSHERAVAVVRAAVELARTMGLVTVAEGVEDKETYEAVAALGVDLIQGYYVAPPMPLGELSHFLESVGSDEPIVPSRTE